MEEQVTTPAEPEQLPEDMAGETVELVETPADLTPVEDALTGIQQSLDSVVILLAILCGLVLAGFASMNLHDMWRR